MDKTSQELFDSLVGLEAESLSQEELGFLMARRGYMSAEQKKHWSKEIDLHEDGKLFKAPKASKTEDAEEGSEDEEEAPTPKKGKGKK